jgi:hypothetical protein
MKPPPDEIVRRLSYILYLAWCEARNTSGDSQRIFDLADAFHNAPALFVNYSEGWLQALREDLRCYYEKHLSTHNYARYLDDPAPEDSQWLWLWQEPDQDV